MKVIFKYSCIYNKNWRIWLGAYGKNKFRDDLSFQKMKKYIKEIEEKWRPIERDILRELARITGLKWREKTVYCYVVSNCIPFSDPLTVSANKNKDVFFNNLIHELIHQLFTQGDNYWLSRKSWAYFYRKYKGESETTIVHIPLHAIYEKVMLKYFGQERLQSEIARVDSLSEYKKAWMTVQAIGHDEIINEFKKKVL